MAGGTYWLTILPETSKLEAGIQDAFDRIAKNTTVTPKIDTSGAAKAGQEIQSQIEKSTKKTDVKVEPKVQPKVDSAAAQDAGRKAGEEVAKGTSGSSSAVGQAIIGALEGAGGEAGRRLGEKLSQAIPTGMTGDAERIGAKLRAWLPSFGQMAGSELGAGLGIGIADAIGKERLDKAGAVVMSGLTKAVNVANKGTDIGVSIGNKIAGGLTVASGVIGNAAAGIATTVGGISVGIDSAKQLLGGDDSWAAPGLDALNGALESTTPLLGAVNGAATLASAGAQAISIATSAASKAQLLWNAALIANPIGLVVAAIAAVVAGLVLFFTKTEIGRKIWQGFTEYLGVAWEAIKGAFSAAWGVISAIWDSMVAGARAVWDGIKSAFGGVVDFIGGLPAAIGRVASGMWDGISNAFKSMIDKLKGWWNGFADALSFTTPDWLPGDPVSFSLPKFAGGGYTGSMGTNQVAGVVHGGEYVIQASSRKRIENAYPMLLDYLNNNGKLPGYKGGGAVGNITSDEQRSMWDAITSRFPNATLNSATRSNMTEGHPDFHNAGRAIDIGGPNMGQIAAWIASTYPESLELIHSPFNHNIKDGRNVGDGNAVYGAGTMAKHSDHVHWALGHNAAGSQVGAGASGSTSSSSSSSLGSSSSSGTSSSAAGSSSSGSGESSQSSSGGATSKQDSKVADAGQQFGQMFVSGLLESIGLDGSVFSNPLEWPTVKSAMAGINWLGKLLSGEGQSTGASDTAATGGGTVGAVAGGGGAGIGGVLSAIPSIADTVTSGSPNLAPGDFNPAVAGGTLAPATPGGMSSFAPAPHQGTGQAPGPIDNSININNPVGDVPPQWANQTLGVMYERNRVSATGMP